MKRLVLFVLLLLTWWAPPAAAHDPHEKGGEPWENPTLTRSVQSDAVTLALALGGVAVFGLAARRRRAANLAGNKAAP